MKLFMAIVLFITTNCFAQKDSAVFQKDEGTIGHIKTNDTSSVYTKPTQVSENLW